MYNYLLSTKVLCIFWFLCTIIGESRAQDSLLSIVKEEITGWGDFSTCNSSFCIKACSPRNKTADGIVGVCDSNSTDHVCKCDRTKFSHAALRSEGVLRVANTSLAEDSVCINACTKLSGYGRIWNAKESDGTDKKYCLCLTGQISRNGYTSCDRHNREKCIEVCQNEDANCAFNGVCLCRATWPRFFNLSEKYSRMENSEEKLECSMKCREYNYDWVSRVYDIDPRPPGDTSPFAKKFCLCGEEVLARNATIGLKLREEGFQVCTGLKCKQRCQSVAAYCEPEHRRACYCNNQNIFIKKHLWSRLPSHSETMCQETCFLAGLDARVIEWNPFFVPADQESDHFYRRTPFQYLYDGKFCHCIKIEINLNQFRPCTDELCEFVCGHYEGVCDMKTRRACMCNTHKLLLNTGRIPEPTERPCDITCRANKLTGKVLDVTWKTTVAHWGGSPVNKYCACVRPVSSAGLSHCEPENDLCPSMCENAEAYCTREKFCQCGEVLDLSSHKNVRKGTPKEHDECSEKCRSWMWPLAADLDNKAWIYDFGLENVSITDHDGVALVDNSSVIATRMNHTEEDPLSFTFQESPGQVALTVEALSSWTAPKKYCLCTKTKNVFHRPGFRGIASIEPSRVPYTHVPCINNHTCAIVNSGLEILF